MAIVVGTTEVIDNSRNLQNITGASGNYNSFHPNGSSITNVLNMNLPMMFLTMSGNVTFSESNKGAGKTSILILDTSASGHTPTFSANVKWAEDAEPTWSDYRYWNIALVSWDGNTIRAAAVGFNS